MRRATCYGAIIGLVAFLTAFASPLSPIHAQRYAMGTMFDVVVYHPSVSEAERAVQRALNEVVRLDNVLSHYKADSDLSMLVSGGREGFVSVDPSLYEVIRESIAFSRRSDGTFDVTIAPLLRTWRAAQDAGRRPSDVEIADAKRCVGYEKIQTRDPNQIRLTSDCVDIDLGGIGKGYAVDRALAILAECGIQHALVNAGGSSIAAIGHPPDRKGWPVDLEGSIDGRRTLFLRDASISTSQQNPVSLALEFGRFGEILDPRTGRPAEASTIVKVIAKSATASDALSTTLLLLPIERGKQVLADYDGASAMWTTPSGELQASYRTSGLHLSNVR